MESKFFNLIDPVTNYIDSGKLFRQPLQWLYYIIGVICAIIPFYALYELIDKRIFKYADGEECFAIILIWLVLCAVCAICFLLWFSRARKLSEILMPDARFVAVPGVANFIQTVGEFYGIFIGVFGFMACILMAIFGTSIDIPVINPSGSLLSGVIMAISGYIVIVITRYIAELILSIADIANNTDKIARKQ